MKRKITAIITTGVLTVAIASGALVTTSCEVLTQALAIIGLSLLGVTPANNFGTTGGIDFSFLGQAEDNSVSLNSLASSGLEVQVENDDGTYSDCEFVDEDTVFGNEYNSIVIVIDDSGSMERTYPTDEYGDLCPTCPHDPSQVRADAARDLINRVLLEAPRSHIAVMDFGPDPVAGSGLSATRVLADFTNDPTELDNALDMIDGSQMVGTPLYDSLSEIIDMLTDDADTLEAMLQSEAAVNPTLTQPTTEPIEVTRYIVVLSDGEDMNSELNTLDTLVAQAKEHNIVIHAVGLGPASASFDSPLMQVDAQISAVSNLQEMAQETLGYYASAANPEELRALYDHVALSMTEGYTVDTFNCLPGETDNEPQDMRRVPDSGEKVDGVISFGAVDIPWTMVAP